MSLDLIKSKIKKLLLTNPNVHVNVSMTNPKIQLKNESVTIKGVYPHLFIIEEKSTGVARNHTLQYSDVLMKHIEILELESM